MKTSILFIVLLVFLAVSEGRKCPSLKNYNKNGVQGRYAKKYEPIAERFQKNCFENITLPQGIPNPKERGQVAIYVKDCLVLDMWCGTLNPFDPFAAPIESDTLINSWSVSKAMLSMVFMWMESEDYFEWNDKISDYWPGFAQNGKENITFQQWISHSAGLTLLDAPVTLDDIRYDANFSSLISKLEQQTPIFTPGTQVSYSPIVKGWYGFIIPKFVDPLGRNMIEIFQQEIEPYLEYSDFFWFYRPEDALDLLRTAVLTPGVQIIDPISLQYALLLQNPSSVQFRSIFNPAAFTDPNFVNTINSTVIIGPGFACRTNALSVANAYRFIAGNGKSQGYKLFRVPSVNRATTLVYSGPDANLLSNATYSQGGFTKGLLFDSFSYRDSVTGHPGSGGNFGFADRNKEVAFAYITAVQSSSSASNDTPFNTYTLVDELYKILDPSI